MEKRTSGCVLGLLKIEKIAFVVFGRFRKIRDYTP